MQDESILDSVKKVLGISAEYDVFDQDIMMHINSAFATLHQIGIGPDIQFTISGEDETWGEFTCPDTVKPMVPSYIYMKVRMAFDPPASSFTQNAFKDQISEYEWRMNVEMETPAVGGSE